MRIYVRRILGGARFGKEGERGELKRLRYYNNVMRVKYILFFRES